MSIQTLDDANQAAIEQGKALRVQPSAPRPTEFYFVENDEWKKQVCGHRHASTVAAETVRTAVRNAFDRDNVMAVNKSQKDKYA